MKKFFENHKKIFLAAGAGLFLIVLLVFGGTPALRFKAFQDLSALKGVEVKNPLPAAAIVTKVIDGDTIVVQGGNHVRLLGIDSDEKGYPCYDAARLKLETLILGKEVRLEKDQEDKDQYQRFLRYVFAQNMNVNLEMVKEGLAVARFYPENQKYKQEITAAETLAINQKIGCKWSKP